MNTEVVIDAKGGVLGRVASFAAKQALLGKKVTVVNCKEVILLGSRANIVKEYQHARNRGGSSMNGPFLPKNPERLVKRTIRGMLDYSRGRGEAAFARVMCHNLVPAEFAAAKKVTLVKDINSKTMTLTELEKVI